MENPGNTGGQLAYCLWSGPSIAIGSILELGAELFEPANETLATADRELHVPPSEYVGNWEGSGAAGLADAWGLCVLLFRGGAAVLRFHRGACHVRFGDSSSQGP